MRTLMTLVTTLFLFCFTPLAFGQSTGAVPDDLIERQVLVMFETDAVTLRQPSVQRLSAATMSAAVRSVLSDANTHEIAKGFPDFQRADTVRVLSGGRVYRVPDYTNLFVLTVAAGTNRDSLIARLERLPQVRYAEKNQRVVPRRSEASAIPLEAARTEAANQRRAAALDDEVIPSNQRRFNEQWGLRNTQNPEADIEATQAWTITTGSSSNIIGIIDGGVQESHVDLSGKVSGQTTGNDHGTHVAGIAAAYGNNPNGGIAGVNWNAQIHAEPLSNNLVTTARSIDDAVVAGARTINNSWGSADRSTTLNQSLRSAYEADVLLVHANPYEEGTPGLTSDYPNSIGPWIMNVGAMNRNAPKGGPWNNTGAKSYTDIGAPGVDIISTIRNGSWASFAGTSMAAPHVTGAASLLLDVNPDLRNYDIEEILKRTAREYPRHDSRIGYGMINAYAALQRVTDPYEVTHGPATFRKVDDDYQAQFTRSPLPGLAAGHYFCDIYELKATANFSYQEKPWTWLGVTEKGYSGANPNNAARYLDQSVSHTSMSMKTYFYFIESDLQGRRINRWAPFDPTAYRRSGAYEYTVLGIPGTPPPPPLRVGITGSYSLNEHQTGNWTANASGGTGGSYSYQWYRRDAGQSNWLRVGSNSRTYRYTWFRSGNHGIKVEVTRGSARASAQITVQVWPGGGCDAALASNDGENGALSSDSVSIDAPPPPCATLAGAEELHPTAFGLESNYPNPFTGRTQLRYALPEASHVKLVVYDALGREVARLVDQEMPVGYHTATFEAQDLPSGVYVYHLRAGEAFAKSGKMVLVR